MFVAEEPPSVQGFWWLCLVVLSSLDVPDCDNPLYYLYHYISLDFGGKPLTQTINIHLDGDLNMWGDSLCVGRLALHISNPPGICFTLNHGWNSLILPKSSKQHWTYVYIFIASVWFWAGWYFYLLMWSQTPEHTNPISRSFRWLINRGDDCTSSSFRMDFSQFGTSNLAKSLTVQISILDLSGFCFTGCWSVGPL